MNERTPGDTRERILAAALDLFANHGYERTSLRQIAEQLGLTKAAILYHFPAKDHIMAALIEPLLSDLETAIDTAERLDPRVGRWAVVEGILDTYLKHRPTLLTLRHDLSILVRQPYFQRFMRIPQRTVEIIAGPRASVPERVRAAQVLSMLGDPLVFFPDVPAEELRSMVLGGARRLFVDDPGAAHPGPTASRRGAPRRPGRPRVLSGERLEVARHMYRTGSRSVDQIAAALGVSRATVYRSMRSGGAI